MKIFIFGITGSGKSFLAKQLSQIFEIKCYDLDDLEWCKKYSERRILKDKIYLLNEILKKENWIIEGIYTHWTEKAVKNCDFLVWLKPDLKIVKRRLILRFVKNKFSGRKETLRDLKSLVRCAKNYYKFKEKNEGYKNHLLLVQKNKSALRVIKNNFEMDCLIREIKNEHKK